MRKQFFMDETEIKLKKFYIFFNRKKIVKK